MFFCLPAFKHCLAEQWDWTHSIGLLLTVPNWLWFSFSSRTNQLHSAKRLLPSEQHFWFGSWPPYQLWGLLYKTLWQVYLLQCEQASFCATHDDFFTLGYEIKAVKGSSEREQQPVLLPARCATVPAFRPEPAVLLHSPSLTLSDCSLLSYLSSFVFRPPFDPNFIVWEAVPWEPLGELLPHWCTVSIIWSCVSMATYTYISPFSASWLESLTKSSEYLMDSGREQYKIKQGNQVPQNSNKIFP